jgi:hypothetical protein
MGQERVRRVARARHLKVVAGPRVDCPVSPCWGMLRKEYSRHWKSRHVHPAYARLQTLLTARRFTPTHWICCVAEFFSTRSSLVLFPRELVASYSFKHGDSHISGHPGRHDLDGAASVPACVKISHDTRSMQPRPFYGANREWMTGDPELKNCEDHLTIATSTNRTRCKVKSGLLHLKINPRYVACPPLMNYVQQILRHLVSRRNYARRRLIGALIHDQVRELRRHIDRRGFKRASLYLSPAARLR